MAYVYQNGIPTYVPEQDSVDKVQTLLKNMQTSSLQKETKEAKVEDSNGIDVAQIVHDNNQQDIKDSVELAGVDEAIKEATSNIDPEEDDRSLTSIKSEVKTLISNESDEYGNELYLNKDSVAALAKSELVNGEANLDKAQLSIENSIKPSDEPLMDTPSKEVESIKDYLPVDEEDTLDIKDTAAYGKNRSEILALELEDKVSDDAIQLNIGADVYKKIQDEGISIAKANRATSEVDNMLEARHDTAAGWNGAPRPVDIRYAMNERDSVTAPKSRFIKNMRLLSSAVGSNQYNLCLLVYQKDPTTGVVSCNKATSLETMLTEATNSISDCVNTICARSVDKKTNWNDAWLFRIKGITIPEFKKSVEGITYGNKQLSLATSGLEYAKSLKFDLQLDSAYNLGEAIFHLLGVTEEYKKDGKYMTHDGDIPMATMYNRRGVDADKKTSHAFDLTSLTCNRWYETHYVVAVVQTLSTTNLFNAALGTTTRPNIVAAAGGNPYVNTVFLLKDFKLATADTGLVFDADKKDPISWPVTCTFTGLKILSTH